MIPASIEGWIRDLSRVPVLLCFIVVPLAALALVYRLPAQQAAQLEPVGSP